jgi:hypothetical protein
LYHGLTTAAPNIQASQIGDYFKDATFGVPGGELGTSESPEPGVTIEYDKGGANVAFDESTWQNAPYTQQDLQDQVAYIATLPGGQQLISDGENYIDGINAYIKIAEANPLTATLYLPGEYLALGQPEGPKPFSLTDIISTASLIGGQPGQGRGQQLRTAILYQQFTQRFGAEQARAHDHRAARPGLGPVV